MKRLSVETKKNVLTLFLNTSIKREIFKKRLVKKEKNTNPCYICLKAYINTAD
ncbi:hypothetical protein [Bacillus sp. OK048]|uniref:hypothetical protein n=1 Tax=Bacillus sp. OK048 TaxID=1882761 RepID=UPI0008862DD0|nr:hypothetical protein [Bacillus sp. OK048]SDM18322.1 hypothetical protein SAMN05443253_102207 [Bacillus sp. OK048]